MADICLVKVDKAYGTQPVLRQYSQCFSQGARYALMGSSGSGKTTITRLLMGLEQPDSGWIEGMERTRFCCVFQEDRLCEGYSALGNAALVLPQGKTGGLPAAFAAVGLRDIDLNKPVAMLSGGERRRVALVRAVEAQGDFLVLDEPFKGLDETTRRMACRYVAENLRGRTLLLVSHDPEDAAALDTKTFHISPLLQNGEISPGK